MEIAWQGDVGGALAVAGAEGTIASPEALALHLDGHASEASSEELGLLGIAGLLLCIRDVRLGRAGAVLPAAERALQQRGPRFDALTQAEAFVAGMDDLLAHLEPTRSEPHHVLAYLALLFLERRLAERSALEG